jgi:hypothetical protein
VSSDWNVEEDEGEVWSSSFSVEISVSTSTEGFSKWVVVISGVCLDSSEIDSVGVEATCEEDDA